MINKKTFVCSNCGECCKPVVILTSKDIDRIKDKGYKDFLELDPIHPENGYVTLKRKLGYCIFYNRKESRCNIYDIRPEICRIYPFMEKKELVDCKPRIF